MDCFISLSHFFFLVVDGPLQTDVILMCLNINGSELRNRGGPSEMFIVTFPSWLPKPHL